MSTQASVNHLADFEPICPKCQSHQVDTIVIESSCGGYEDEKNTCQQCFYVWWVDGIDS